MKKTDVNAPQPEEARAMMRLPAPGDPGEEVALVPMAQPEYSGRILVRVPKSLHKRLIERAKVEGVSLNQYILYLLSQ